MNEKQHKAQATGQKVGSEENEEFLVEQLGKEGCFVLINQFLKIVKKDYFPTTVDFLKKYTLWR